MSAKWTSPLSCPLFGTFFTLVALTAISRIATCRPVCPLFCNCNIGQFLINCTDQGVVDIPYSESNDSFSWAKVFVFERNHITEIGRTSFESFHNLVVLSLAYNGLQSIERGSFVGLQRLKRLDLSGNNLVEIPAALAELPNLQELFIVHNSLWSLDDDTFTGMESLESLYMDNNNIHVNGTPFQVLTSLRVLSLRSNALTEDPVGWFFSSLHNLDLSDNQLSLTTEVRSWFNNSQDTPAVHLKVLVLTNNHIESIERGTLRQLFFLTFLDVGLNQISFIDSQGLHDLYNLAHFAINDNWVESLHEDTFLKTTYLEVLQLENNQLSSLPLELFQKTENLVSLNVANNILENISAITEGGYLPSLADLNLAHNLISEIQGSGFSQFTVLSTLILMGNKLVTVPSISGHHYLETLDLSVNSIRSVPSGAFDGTALSAILLHKNYLETLESELFLDLYDLQHLTIYFNNWWCDCRLQWLQNLYYREEPPIWAIDVIERGIVCNNPPVHQGFDIYYAEPPVMLEGCPEQLNGLAILGVLCVWFGVVGIFVTRMWVRKFSEVHKFKKVGKRNFRYSTRQNRKRRNGVINHYKSRHSFDRSESYTLILQNKDNDDQDGQYNNESDQDEWLEIARVTTV